MIWEHGEESLKDFVSHLNKVYPNIQFQTPFEYSCEMVNFLNVRVTKIGDRLKSDLYTKPTDTHHFLEFSSCHPYHIKRSIPFSQALRFRRICSEDQEFRDRIKQLKGWLSKRGYDMDMVEKQITKATMFSRDEALREKETTDRENKDVLVITYHPALSKEVHEIINRNQCILSLGHEHKELFPQTPMVAIRKPKKIKIYSCQSHY